MQYGQSGALGGKSELASGAFVHWKRSEPMKRTMIVICGIVLVTFVSLQVGCSYESQQQAEAREFWEAFAKRHDGWLTFQDGPLAYELLVSRKDMKVVNGEQTTYWKDYERIKVWSDTGRNVRYQRYSLLHETPVLERESRFKEGFGNRVEIPPRPADRVLSVEDWMSARVGATLLTSLHALAAGPFPAKAQIEQREGETTLILESLRDHKFKLTESKARSVVALNNFAWVGGANWQVPGLTHVELYVDSATCNPTKLVEQTESEQAIIYTFSPSWLTIGEKVAPQWIKVDYRMGSQAFTTTFQFREEGGRWLIQTAQIVGPVWSMCYLGQLQQVSTGPFDASMFELPTDVELPEQSYTTLNPGERIVTFVAKDGLAIEGKLSLPDSGDGPFPVAMLLPGAGPWTFDRPIEYVDLEHPDAFMPRRKKMNYCDFYVENLLHLGVGFFRVNKRGCALAEDRPFERVNRSLFSQATPSILLSDYECALTALREEEGVDANRIVLIGHSEGTTLAPRLAVKSPSGIRALALLGYVEDDLEKVIPWQNTTGAWRNISRLLDEDGDEKITREEYENDAPRLKLFRNYALQGLSFESVDKSGDSLLTSQDMFERNEPALDQLMAAIKAEDADYLWNNLANLTPAYLKEEWDRPSNSATLLKLDIPIAIFHGTHDGSVAVEGARAAEEAFKRANQKNLTVNIFERTNHDLNFGDYLVNGEVPEAFAAMFDYVAEQAKE